LPREIVVTFKQARNEERVREMERRAAAQAASAANGSPDGEAIRSQR